MGTDLKAVMGATSSWVRIPLPPPVLGIKRPRRPKSAGLLFAYRWSQEVSAMGKLSQEELKMVYKQGMKPSEYLAYK